MSDMKKLIKLMESVDSSEFDNLPDDMLLGFANSPGNIEFLMKKEDVDAIAQSGQNDEAVKAVMEEPYIQYQLKQLDFDVIKDHIHEAMPDWHEDHDENTPREEYEMYLIWDIAWSIKDGEEIETEDDYIDSFVKEIRSKM